MIIILKKRLTNPPPTSSALRGGGFWFYGSEKISTWYEDDIGDWVYNPSKMESGLQTFYKETGVQPYVIITDNVNGVDIPTNEQCDAWLDTVYKDIMPDGGHLIFAFIENENGYMMSYYAGTQAQAVFDDECAEILFDYFDRYYTSSMDTEEYFSTCFEKTADRMMSKTTTGADVGKTIVIFIGIAVVLVLVIRMIQLKAMADKEKLEKTKELLNTPIKKSDDDIDDLTDKYN